MKIAEIQDDFLAAAEHVDNTALIAATASHVSDTLPSQTGALVHLYIVQDTLESDSSTVCSSNSFCSLQLSKHADTSLKELLQSLSLKQLLRLSKALGNQVCTE